MSPSAGAPPLRLDTVLAARLAQRALANVGQEYPYQPAYLQLAPGDHGEPHVLHPAFCGSYDWHSCVHMHWLLARVRRLHPGLAEAPAIAAVLDAHLAPGRIAVETAYFARPGSASFERTYGWAWLLALAGELRRGDAVTQRCEQALAPLTEAIVARYLDYLPRAGYPIRHGMHANSAFGLALALDYARVGGAGALERAVIAAAHRWFAGDRALPIAWEPSGADFLSPALMEAALMCRVLPAGELARWLSAALPALRDGARIAPVAVSDRTDPQIVHLDGLNLSRAWCLDGIAAALPAGDARGAGLRASAQEHLAAGMAGLDSADYVGTHWLGTFALLALTG
jgi:hypothetical protein